MSNNISRLAAMAALALGAGALMPAAPGTSAPEKAMLSTRVPAMPDLRRIFRGSGDGWSGRPHRRGPGWTHAHVQRIAAKRRNQLRHKRACRRARKAR